MTNLSEFYKFFEQYHLQGHAIGRKLGDLLEIITIHYLEEKISNKLEIKNEERIEGISQADHKVEFLLKSPERITGLVECKRVGVEVTTGGQTIRNNILNIQNNILSFNFENRASFLRVTVNNNLTENNKIFDLHLGETFKIVIPESPNNSNPLIEPNLIISPNENISGIQRNIKEIRLITLNQNSSLNQPTFTYRKAFPHPATIEKAKQIGWVAVDVRKKELGHWGKEECSPELLNLFRTVLVITEASHWDEKSRKVITTALDYVLVLKDTVIIEIVKEFILQRGLNNFNQISMRYYKNNEGPIKEIIRKICERFSYNIFEDLEGNNVDLCCTDQGYLLLNNN